MTAICVDNEFGDAIPESNPVSVGGNNCIQFKIWEQQDLNEFIGRKTELEVLHSLVTKEELLTTSSSHHRYDVTILTGTPGVGKSTLAQKYAHDYSKNFDHNLIYLNARTRKTLSQSIRALAQKLADISFRMGAPLVKCDHLDVQTTLNRIFEFLANSKYLLILDNVTAHGLPDILENYLPKEPQNVPFVLLITESAENVNKILNLTGFTKEDAIQMIEMKIELRDPNDLTNANAVALKLQYSPLAIEQAITYIVEMTSDAPGSRIKEFLRILDESMKKYSNILEIESPNDKILSAILNLILKFIRKTTSENVIQILNMTAYCRPNIDIKSICGDKYSAEEIQEAIDILLKFKMAKKNMVSKVVIHRATQKLFRIVQSVENIEETTLRNLLALGKTTLLIWSHAVKYDDLIMEFVDLFISVVQYSCDCDTHCLLLGVERLSKLFGPNHKVTIKFKCELLLSFKGFLCDFDIGSFVKLAREINSYFEIVIGRLNTIEAFDYELLRKVAECVQTEKEFNRDNRETLRLYQILQEYSKSWSTIEDEKALIQYLVELEKFEQIAEFSKEYRKLHSRNWTDEFLEMRLDLADFMFNSHKGMIWNALTLYEDVYYRIKDKLYDSEYHLALRSLKGMTSALLRLLPNREEYALLFAEKINELAHWHDDDLSIMPLRTLYDVSVELKELGYTEKSLEYLNYCEEQTRPGFKRFNRQGRCQLRADAQRVVEEMLSEVSAKVKI